MGRVTSKDKIRNNYKKRSMKMASIVDKVQENRLGEYRYVLKRGETETLRLVKKTMYISLYNDILFYLLFCRIGSYENGSKLYMNGKCFI